MKKLFLFFTVLVFGAACAQKVVLTKVLQTITNADRGFYKIDTLKVAADYLGELEVQGFSADDASVFNSVYRKAKDIGGNAFIYMPFMQIDGSAAPFNPAHYRLRIYHADLADIPKDTNKVYLFGSAHHKTKYYLNSKQNVLAARSYTSLSMEEGVQYSISTGRFLGSGIKVGAQPNQPATYFQFSGFSVNSKQGEAGINFKTGDMIRLEQSYAQFLTVIYQEN